MKQYPMRLDDVWRLLLPIIGARKANSYAELDEDTLTLRYGFFEVSIRLIDIESVEEMKWPWYAGVGLRLGPGPTVGLIGSTQEVVKVELRSPHPVKVPFTIRVKVIAASLESHLTFIDDLQARLVALKQVPR